MKEIYFSLISEYPKNVIYSQAIEYLSKLEKYDIKFKVLFLLPFQVLIKNRKDNHKHTRTINKHIDRGSFFIPIWKSLNNIGRITSTIILFIYFIRYYNYDRIILHCRGTFTSNVASKLKRFYKNLHYIIDVRGDYEAEYAYTLRKRGVSEELISKNIIKFSNSIKGAFYNSDHIFCVSEILKKRLIQNYNVSKNKILVIPCLADEERFLLNNDMRDEFRKELNINDNFVFIYAGGIGTWHNSNLVFEIISKIKIENTKIFFIILTPHSHEAKICAEKYLPEGSYIIQNAKRDEVPKFLQAADMGILLRKKDPLNEVAAPTKFAEYMMTGLPTLISENIGDYSDYVYENKFGVVLTNDPQYEEYHSKIEEFIKNYESVDRKLIAEMGRDMFSKDKYMKEMSLIYKNL